MIYDEQGGVSMSIEVGDDGSNVRLTGDQIRHVREVLGESQAKFARRFGVTQPSVVRWEGKGDVARSGPEIILIRALADQFKIAIPPAPATPPAAAEDAHSVNIG